MHNSTLGGLIKDYRTQKGISQLDIAFALGWKETSRLSRIEQGRMEKPSRELVDKIIEAIGLKEEEKNTLLLTGGYLPNETEIIKVKEAVNKTLQEWPYPAGMIDFSWRLIDGNDHINDLFHLPPGIKKNIYKSEVRVLDLIFNDSLQKTKLNDIENPKMVMFMRSVLMEFKYEQRHRTKEKWYIEHIRKLMNYEIFRTLWVQTKARDEENIILGKYSTKTFQNPQDPSKLLRFYIFVVPVLQDPRFEVELHTPIDLETYRFYEDLNPKLSK